jgi:hypothetical protein
MAGALTIDNDTGIILGDAQELTISVSSNNVTIAQTSQDKDLSFTINDGGVTKTPLAFTGATGDITLTGNTTVTGNLTITGEFENSSSEINIVNDAFIKLNTGNSETDSGIIVETSDTDDARLKYNVTANYWEAGENATYSQIIRLADATTDGHANNGKVLKVGGSGEVKVTQLTIGTPGAAITPTDTRETVPTIAQVATFGDQWGGSEKTVSTVAPTSGQGNDGDFWFVREA